MKKVLGIFLGLLAGYFASVIVKVVIDFSFPFALDRLGITGEEVDANIVAIANILALFAFVFVLMKVYRGVVGKKNKTKKTEELHQ